MTIGERINKIRTQKGMTLEELGNKVGVGKSTVRKWEIGTICNIKADKIEKLSEALDVSPLTLMGLDEKNKFDNMRTSIISNEYRYLSDTAKDAYTEILACFKFLNDEGANEALKRVSELTEIKKYQK